GRRSFVTVILGKFLANAAANRNRSATLGARGAAATPGRLAARAAAAGAPAALQGKGVSLAVITRGQAEGSTGEEDVPGPAGLRYHSGASRALPFEIARCVPWDPRWRESETHQGCAAAGAAGDGCAARRHQGDAAAGTPARFPPARRDPAQ